MTPPERILVVIPSSEAGGAEAQTLRVARGLAAMGAEVLVAADPSLTGRLGTDLPLRPAALAFDPDAESGPMRARQAAALAPVLAGFRPEAALIGLGSPQEGFGALQALEEAGVPTLAVAHLVRRDWKLGAADRAVAAALRTGWAAVSAPSARRLEALFGLPQGRVAAVPNGLPVAAPARPASRAGFGLPEGVPILVSVGRLDSRKGAALAPGIATRIAPAVVALAGTGPLEAALRGAPGVHLVGHVAEIPGLLALADAFLLASEHEGAPLAVLEAARAGTPLLATSAALEAWPEAAEMARLVIRDPASIAAAFAESLADRAGTARRVAVAREVAAAWDEAAMIRRTAWLLAAEAAR